MKPGDRKYWTKQREKALLKLGRKAETGMKIKDWQYARDCCPKESELLKDRTNEQLRKIYSRIVKSSQGICIKEGCDLATDDGNRYCEVHRREQADKSLEYWNKTGKAKREKKKTGA